MSKYKFIKVEGKRVLEHRYVLGQSLGRKLLRDEHVHHINGKKDDNRLENLMIVDKHEHAGIHSKIGFERAVRTPVKLRLMSKLLTLRQVTDIVGVSIRTLHRWDKSGKLKSVRINSRGDRRYREEDLLVFVTRNKGAK